MRLFYRQFVAAVIFCPLLLKRRIQGGKQLAGDVIRTVQQSVACTWPASSREATSASEFFFSKLTAIAHPYKFNDFLIAIIFITDVKGVTVLYTVW